MSYLNTAGATGEEQRGPVDLAALVQLAISGELSWETLVWAPSFADWQLASEIPELAAVLPPPAGAAEADAIFGGSVLPLLSPTLAHHTIEFMRPSLAGGALRLGERAPHLGEVLCPR